MGMAGFFTTAYRTPIAALLMVSELTGSYFLLLPSMWVCALCFLINGRWSIVSTQVPSPVDSAAHLGHFFNDILAGIKVEDVFDGKRPRRTLRPESSIDDCKRLVTESHQTVYPVVEENGRLCGIFNMNDLRGFLYDETLGLVAVADDVATKDIIVIRPRDTLASAMRRFTLKNLEELPVVETTEDGGYRFLGLITRREVIGYYNQTVDELRQQRRDEGYDQAGETSGSQRRLSVRVRSSETQHDDD
jgi:CIC family chloride channel protein